MDTANSPFVLTLLGGIVAILTVYIQVSTERKNRRDHGVTTDEIRKVREDIVSAREILLDSRETVQTLAVTVDQLTKSQAKQNLKLDEHNTKLIGTDHKIDNITSKVELLDKRVEILERSSTPMIVYPGSTNVTLNEEVVERAMEQIERESE